MCVYNSIMLPKSSEAYFIMKLMVFFVPTETSCILTIILIDIRESTISYSTVETQSMLFYGVKCCFFSSPELIAKVSFSDNYLSIQ